MITGPKGSFYENGCFIFDIWYPPPEIKYYARARLITARSRGIIYPLNQDAEGVSQVTSERTECLLISVGDSYSVSRHHWRATRLPVPRRDCDFAAEDASSPHRGAWSRTACGFGPGQSGH